MNPAPAVITVTGGTPLVIAPIYPAAGNVQVAGETPTLAAGQDRFLYPATRTITLTGPAPAALQYGEAAVGATRVKLRPAVTGRVGIKRG